MAIVYSTNDCEFLSTKIVHTFPTESETGLVGRAEQHSPTAATRISPAVTEEPKLTETVAVVPEPVALWTMVGPEDAWTTFGGDARGGTAGKAPVRVRAKRASARTANQRALDFVSLNATPPKVDCPFAISVEPQECS